MPVTADANPNPNAKGAPTPVPSAMPAPAALSNEAPQNAFDIRSRAAAFCFASAQLIPTVMYPTSRTMRVEGVKRFSPGSEKPASR